VRILGMLCDEMDRFRLWHDMNKVLAIVPWLVIKGGEILG
jgi:hypothetical protein